MLSVIVNLVLAVSALAAVFAHARKSPLSMVLRYFTVLSNLLCAAAALAVAGMRLRGAVSAGILLFKFVGTVAVMVTLLTVVLFLWKLYGYKNLLSGPDFWLHLICPLLALLSWLLWDRTPLTPGQALFGVLPVLLYGCMYLYKVVVRKTWEDFYGFNRDGKWPVSFAVMLVGTALLSLLLAAPFAGV